MFCKGQTTLSTKSRWRFRTKRRSKESFDHTRLCTFRFHISRLVTVRQSKTHTNVEYRSRAGRLENDEMTKRVFLHPPRSLIYDVRYVNIFMKVVLTTSMTPYENVVLYWVWFGPKGQTTLSTKSRWRFRTKRRSKGSFDHTRLCTFRFHINRLVTVRQSKTRTNVEYRSRAV